MHKQQSPIKSINNIMYSSQNKRSIFKLSGNMALGGNISTPRVPDPPSTYSAEELVAAKNSLRLLKSKQPQKESLSSQEYQRQYNNNNLNSYDTYQKYGGGSTYQNKYARQDKLDNEFMELGYKAKVAPKNSYQNIKSSDMVYNNAPKPIQKPYEQMRKKQNVSQKKYNKFQQQPYKQKQYLPARNRGIPQKNTSTNINTNTNTFQDVPIKNLQSSTKQLPNQYQDDDTHLVECKAGCGRSFKPSVLRTHEKVCKKVFQTKRKEFNAQDQRVVEYEQKKLMKKGASKIPPKQEESKVKGPEKIAKWKAQSLQFRQIIKGGSNKPRNAEEEKQYQQMQSAIKEASGYIKCPTCGRSFNEKAGNRHIPHCAEQAKKNKFKK